MYLDTIPPAFSIIPPEQFVNTPQVTLSGTYGDGYIGSITRIPQKTEARIDTLNKTFSLTITLHEGTNLINLTCMDKALNSTNSSLHLNADFTPPRLKFREFTSQTDKQIVLLQGSYAEDNLESIIANPGEIHAVINESFHVFKLSVPLKIGENTIRVQAKDLAGNVSEYTYAVIRTPRSDTSVVSISKEEFLQTQETISQLTMQVEQLQENRNQPSAATSEEKSSIASLKRKIYTLKKENDALKKKAEKVSNIPVTEVPQDTYNADSLEQVIAVLTEENLHLEGTISTLKTEIEQIKVSSPSQGGYIKYVWVSAAVLRDRPDINSNDIGRVYKNKPVTVLYELNYWTRVITEDGWNGYIRNTLLKDEIEE